MQSTTARQPRQPVLVVIHSNGFVQVYGDKSLVDVHIGIIPSMTSDEGQILAEQYFELEIPKRHRDVFWPVNLLDTHQVRTRTPADIAQRETGLALCNVLSEIGQDARAEVVEWVA